MIQNNEQEEKKLFECDDLLIKIKNDLLNSIEHVNEMRESEFTTRKKEVN